MDSVLVLEWIAIVVLVCLSGLFSGLNLGLMGLDPLSLQVVMGGSEPNSSYASKIKPLRDCGNWLLCTLLLGNVAVNAALSILLADKSDALIGFLVSTIIIVIFGEIIPQALCSRYALFIGAHTTWIVWILMGIISICAYPLAMILDKILGQELGIHKIYIYFLQILHNKYKIKKKKRNNVFKSRIKKIGRYTRKT